MRYCDKCRANFGLIIYGTKTGAYCDLCNTNAQCYNVMDHAAKKRTIYHVNDSLFSVAKLRKNYHKGGVYPQTQLHGNIVTNRYRRTENRYAIYMKDNGTSYTWITHDEYKKFSANAKHVRVENVSDLLNVKYTLNFTIPLKKPLHEEKVDRYKNMYDKKLITLEEYKALVQSI